MISGVAFCPHPPALVPEIVAGAAGELDGLRAACLDAIRAIAQPGRRLVVLGSGPRSQSHPPSARGTLAGFGVPVQVQFGASGSEAPPELPLSLTIAAWLIARAVGPVENACGFSVGPDFAEPAVGELHRLTGDDDVALLVMGDGSARRSTTAPGYVDERAVPFDAVVERALAAGDAGTLASLDADLGTELLAAGVPAWRAAGRLLAGERYDAQLTYCDDPYGVAYFVAVWQRRG